jgi:hypothetical protein
MKLPVRTVVASTRGGAMTCEPLLRVVLAFGLLVGTVIAPPGVYAQVICQPGDPGPGGRPATIVGTEGDDILVGCKISMI